MHALKGAPVVAFVPARSRFVRVNRPGRLLAFTGYVSARLYAAYGLVCPSFQKFSNRCLPSGLASESVYLRPNGRADCVQVSASGAFPEVMSCAHEARPSGRISVLSSVRLTLAAALLGVSLASCGAMAPVVQCVPDSIYLPCKAEK